MKKEELVCEEHHHDASHQKSIMTRIPTEDEAIDAAELFSRLGSSTRLRLLCALSVGDICVCELADVLGISQPAVSHHLRLLRESGIVRYSKQGKEVIYRFSDTVEGKLTKKIIEDILANGGKEDAK